MSCQNATNMKTTSVFTSCRSTLYCELELIYFRINSRD